MALIVKNTFLDVVQLPNEGSSKIPGARSTDSRPRASSVPASPSTSGGTKPSEGCWYHVQPSPRSTSTACSASGASSDDQMLDMLSCDAQEGVLRAIEVARGFVSIEGCTLEDMDGEDEDEVIRVTLSMAPLPDPESTAQTLELLKQSLQSAFVAEFGPEKVEDDCTRLRLFTGGPFRFTFLDFVLVAQ